MVGSFVGITVIAVGNAVVGAEVEMIGETDGFVEGAPVWVMLAMLGVVEGEMVGVALGAADGDPVSAFGAAVGEIVVSS